MLLRQLRQSPLWLGPPIPMLTLCCLLRHRRSLTIDRAGGCSLGVVGAGGGRSFDRRCPIVTVRFSACSSSSHAPCVLVLSALHCPASCRQHRLATGRQGPRERAGRQRWICPAPFVFCCTRASIRTRSRELARIGGGCAQSLARERRQQDGDDAVAGTSRAPFPVSSFVNLRRHPSSPVQSTAGAPLRSWQAKLPHWGSSQ